MSIRTKGRLGRNIPPISHYPTLYAGRNTHVAVMVTRGGMDAAEAEANADYIVKAWNAHDDLCSALVQAIESMGFSVSGPTDHRAAEDGEPMWVCNARLALSLS